MHSLRTLYRGICLVAQLALASCALTGGVSEGGTRESAPCGNCRSEAPQTLRFEAEAAYREWGKAGPLDSAATVGLLPPLRLVVPEPGDCSICHAFSSDAVEFDFSTSEETLLRELLPAMTFHILHPGLQVPDRDSTLLQNWTDSLMRQTFADGRPLSELAPWRARSGEQHYPRVISPGLRQWLGAIGGRYGIRYLVIPVHLEVELLPRKGARGGFRWESLWSWWDVHKGELVVLDYRSFTAISTNAAPPDRQWSASWAAGLKKGLKDH